MGKKVVTSRIGRFIAQCMLTPEEWLFALASGSRALPSSHATLRVAYHRHHGETVTLPDGTKVRRGDPIAEIHFWNRMIARRVGSDAQEITWAFIRDLRADFRTLATLMASGRFAQKAVAVYGASPVARGATRFGFWVRTLPPGVRTFALTRWQLLLRASFHPAKVQSTLTQRTVEVWMSRDEFIRRFAGTKPLPVQSTSRPFRPTIASPKEHKPWSSH